LTPDDSDSVHLDDQLGVYATAAEGDQWSIELRRRRLVRIGSDGTRAVSRYRAIERDDGVLLLLAEERWWLVTEGGVRFLVPDEARTPFCLAHIGGDEPAAGEFGFWLRASTAGAGWALPNAPKWLVDCQVPSDAAWSGLVVAADPSASSSGTVLVAARPSDHVFVPAPVVACVDGPPLEAVFIAIGATDQRANELAALVQLSEPHPVGTPVILRPRGSLCPDAP
jgi:hypothetical protein